MELSAVPSAPNPYLPILGFTLEAVSNFDMREHSVQHRRRAEILAAARRLLASDGYQRFTIRSLSAACSLTPQTIHNSFGCKNDLLRAAMNQHTLMLDSSAISQTRNPAMFLILALSYCLTAVERPEFLREFMHAVSSPRQPLRDPLLKFGIDLKTQMFRSMARKGLLRACIDPRTAAEQIAYVNTFAIVEWTENDDMSDLYQRLIFGNGSILLGVLAPHAAREIEEWLSDPAHRQWPRHGGPDTSALRSPVEKLVMSNSN